MTDLGVHDPINRPVRSTEQSPGAAAQRIPRPQCGGQRRAPRLVDIADAAGVHVSTVSRVLNGDPAQCVRRETSERVVSAARALGYRPNAALLPVPWVVR
ncbi:MAG: LacI family DNA-binding transcriptional regulator [Streptosporangiaceae bacterium]